MPEVLKRLQADGARYKVLGRPLDRYVVSRAERDEVIVWFAEHGLNCIPLKWDGVEIVTQ